MALAKKCDRCGVCFDMYNVVGDPSDTNGFMFLNIDGDQSYGEHEPIDLCHACNDMLHHWLEHPERDGEGS